MLIEGTDMDPSASEHLLVIATSHERRPLNLLFHGRKFRLMPEQPTNIPYLAMVLWFGNPSARDVSETDRDRMYRRAERERLSAKWGLNGGEQWYKFPDDYDDPTVPRTQALFDDPSYDYVSALFAGRNAYRHPFLPNVECNTYDGKRIITIIDDPLGEIAFPDAATSNRTEIEQLQHTVEALRQQMLMTLNELSRVNPDAAAALAHAVPPRIQPSTDNTIPTFDASQPAIHPSMQQQPDAVDLAQQALQQLTHLNAQADGSVTLQPAPTQVPDLAALGLSDAVEADPVPTHRATTHQPT